jgi:hypothetical protein
MREPDTRKKTPTKNTAATPQNQNAPTDDGYEDEEKLLAGQNDVNMPALLTRDVKGG